MPEQSLLLSVDDLKGEIGSHLGYGRGTPFNERAWTIPQTNDIKGCLRTGLANVYTPSPLGEGQPAWNWSWLRPYQEWTIAQGQAETDLPATFGGFESDIYVLNPRAANQRWPLKVAQEGMVQECYSRRPDTSGPPQIAAERVKAGTTATGSTRSVLYVFPLPDADYTISASWKHNPEALSGSYPYPPGGQEHAELFVASCRAAAELKLDDQPGPWAQEFMRRMAASIAVDRKRKGTYIGYNGDSSDTNRGGDPRLYNRLYNNPAVTYNGSPIT